MNDKYLEEDSDLLQQIGAIGPMSTGTALSEQQCRLSEIQIKSILRSRKTMIDLDRSNKRYSVAIGAFALVQILIAGLQLILGIDDSTNRYLAFFIGVAFLASILWLKINMNKLIS
ncbi:hypothetical protein N9L18_00510 [Candidatus Pacebacteria bacterium]|nr:hypothetical protein [Candidatus Paceibacterota bacterium]